MISDEDVSRMRVCMNVLFELKKSKQGQLFSEKIPK